MSFWTLTKKRGKKAFDLVDDKILLSKLLFIQFELIALFSLYLKNRVQRVFIRGAYSSEGTVKYGVPKGSVLGPVPFCIYINDLPLHIPSNSAECHMLAYDTTRQTTGKKNQSERGKCGYSVPAATCGTLLVEFAS